MTDRSRDPATSLARRWALTTLPSGLSVNYLCLRANVLRRKQAWVAHESHLPYHLARTVTWRDHSSRSPVPGAASGVAAKTASAMSYGEGAQRGRRTESRRNTPEVSGGTAEACEVIVHSNFPLVGAEWVV